MFFKLLKDALKVKNVRNKILFTIFIIFVFRDRFLFPSRFRGGVAYYQLAPDPHLLLHMSLGVLYLNQAAISPRGGLSSDA